jgi:hypothetical protein
MSPAKSIVLITTPELVMADGPNWLTRRGSWTPIFGTFLL